MSNLNFCRKILDGGEQCSCGIGNWQKDYFELGTKPPTCISCEHALGFHPVPPPTPTLSAQGPPANYIDLWSTREIIGWDKDFVVKNIEERKFFTIWNVNLATPLKGPNLRVYAREEVCRVWKDFANKIKTPQERLIRVAGCPGTGKSVLAWHYACHLAHKGKKVVWFSLLATTDYFAMLMIAKEIQHARMMSPDAMLEILKGLDDDAIVFIDGVRPVHLPAVRTIQAWWLMKPKTRNFVQIQSMQLDSPMRVTDRQRDESKWDEIYYRRWSIDEFVEALNGDDELKQRVLPKLKIDNELSTDSKELGDPIYLRKLVERKAYYAGFSARYMFDFTTEEIKEDIAFATRNIPTGSLKLQTVSDFLILDTSTPVRDALFVKQNDEKSAIRYEPTSAYVLEVLCMAFSMDVLAMMRQYLNHLDKNSRGMKGCVFEKYFHCNLKTCSMSKGRSIMVFFKSRRTTEEWLVTNILKCPLQGSNVVGLDDWVPSKTDDNLWIDPVDPYQKGWDFAHYVWKDSLFRAVQLTIGQKHKVLEYGDVAEWIKSLKGMRCNVKTCELVYLRPESTDPPITLKDGKTVKLDEEFRTSEDGVKYRSTFGTIA